MWGAGRSVGVTTPSLFSWDREIPYLFGLILEDVNNDDEVSLTAVLVENIRPDVTTVSLSPS